MSRVIFSVRRIVFVAAACVGIWLCADAPAFAGPWRVQEMWFVEGFGAVHFLDRSDVNNYTDGGDIERFGNREERGYLGRATPVLGGRLGLARRRFIGDLTVQYAREWRDGPGTGATISNLNLLFHAGVDLVHTRFTLYPYVGAGWSYTNFTVNGDDRLKPRFPDFAGAKEGIPADVGLGIEWFATPKWTVREPSYGKAVTMPIFLHAGYQGEIITYFWQIKHGELARSVTDRFIGPYVRVGIGAGKGSFIR
ncbi:MAG: hypothetical protein IT350_02395 [Deltaproteobacteria bacterium]|nr:hypothetical protein [Deltaproteobacteria bacterium]